MAAYEVFYGQGNLCMETSLAAIFRQGMRCLLNIFHFWKFFHRDDNLRAHALQELRLVQTAFPAKAVRDSTCSCKQQKKIKHAAKAIALYQYKLKVA